ncbi:hypothetical protein [Geoglobus acetivorans]|uniref:DUF7982 domain-containing protein n=1 Tax=Geoglobus acetivorans TaxID=565033 RepID=A0ABZ3H1V6_GEOAI|nr:hypothetical protein [Geoglobus acetivorans]
MKAKYPAGVALIVAGVVIAFKGAMEANQSLVNAGIGGVFLGVVVLSFSTSDHIKYDAFRTVFNPYVVLTRNLTNSLGLGGKSVYIPPYDNMPDGGVFVPLHDDFDLDLARFDDRTVFLTDSGREREMGLLLVPLGRDLVRMYEEYSGMDLAGAGLGAVESVSAVLRSLGLAKSVDVEEEGDEIRVYVGGVKVREFCSRECERIACPVCSSIMLSISKALNELIVVEEIDFNDRFVEISARKLGGVDSWM